MIPNKQQFDKHWLAAHGGVRVYTKQELVGKLLRDFAPVWRLLERQSDELWGIVFARLIAGAKP